MEIQELITRTRSKKDERIVNVSLTKKGELLKMKAAKIPEKIIGKLFDKTFSKDEILGFKETLQKIILKLNDSTTN